MPDELVLDASVVGAAFFNEEATPAARTLLTIPRNWSAPDLIFVEVASLGAKKLRLGAATPDTVAKLIPTLDGLIGLAFPARALAGRALDLAAAHGFSAYDALYLALAEQRRTRVATADIKFAARAARCGLDSLVQRI